MDCTTFVARFTDYLDGVLSSADGREMAQHLEGCVSCLRYKNVVEHGRSVLLSLPVPELREDFNSRLEYRLLHVADEQILPDDVASRAPALAVLGIAVLLTVVAWSPLLLGGVPVVQLEPIVVDHAPSQMRTLGLSVQPSSSDRDVQPELDRTLWDDQRLYEYSQLKRRYQENSRTRQVGLATGR
ncbi:MAG: zf-HC2 domain-containing protein [Gemmatimonadetes bacterium]|nr:zf-HC2 domain-containing protein [Gemmatimonadota bacterium]